MSARSNRTGKKAAVLLTAAAMITLAACGGSPSAAEDPATGTDTGTGAAEEVDLRIAWSGSDARTQVTQEALDLYMDRNPHVNIEVEFTTSANFWDRLTTQVAGGNAPDIIQMSGRFLGRYATSDTLLDLETLPIDISGWEPGPLEAQTVDGTLYAIPGGLDGHAVVYNATKLAELGIDPPEEDWTWSEFADLATEISDAAGEGYWGSKDAGFRYEPLQSFLAGKGKKLFEDGALGFEADDLREYWQLWADLREADAVVPAAKQAEGSHNPEDSGLVQGFAAIDFYTSSQYGNLLGLTEDELGMVPYPFADDGTPGQVSRVSLGWSITAGTEHPEEAAKLVDFIVNDPDAGTILGTSRGVPPSPEVRAQVREEVDEAQLADFDLLQFVQSHDADITPVLPTRWPDIETLLERTHDEIAFGQISLDDGVAKFMAEAEGLMG